MCKRWIGVVLAVLLMVVAVGCDGNTNETPQVLGTEEEFQEILDSVAMLPIGTIGVSMQGIERAVAVLEWCHATDMTEEQIVETVKAYYADFTEDERMLFAEQLFFVTDFCEAMQEEEQREHELMNIGYDAQEYTHWNDVTFSKAEAIASVIEVVAK